MSELLAPDKGELFAVLDGAREDAVHAFTSTAGLPWAYLEDGVVEATYEVCAPRLIALGSWPSTALEQLLAKGWGKSWGVFVRARLNMGALREHLRTLSSVKLPTGRVAQFRFYDPRVLRVYLPSCTYDEVAQVFGPIDEFAMEDEDPAIACRFGRDNGALVVTKLELGAAG
ncbi:DUF4123 domain-containing protein [Enhygromyxa salina]|nr:DUF4123 domain-containing protein [Enhygromyxa salina]